MKKNIWMFCLLAGIMAAPVLVFAAARTDVSWDANLFKGKAIPGNFSQFFLNCCGIKSSISSKPLDKNKEKLFDSVLSGHQYKNKEKFIVEYKAAFDSLKKRVIYKPFKQRPQVLQNDLEAFKDFKDFVDCQNPWLNNQDLLDCTHALSESILRRDKEGSLQNIDEIDTILKPFFPEYPR